MKRLLGVLLGLACAASTARAQDNVFIANQNGNTVTVAHASDYSPLPTTASGGPNPMTVGTAPVSTLYDPVHKLVYVVNSNPASVSVIDPTLFKVTTTITMATASNLQGAVLSQDGNFLFIAGFLTGPKTSGVFQVDLNTLTASFVAGIVIGSGALDCEVLPASSVGGSGSAPGRVYFTASNNLYEINMLSAPLTAVAVPLPTGTNPPTAFTRLARSPDNKFMLSGSFTNGAAGSLWQVIRINPLASPEADFFNLANTGNAGNAIDDVLFQGSAGPPFAVSLMVRDDGGSRLRFVNVGSSEGPSGYTVGPNVPFQFGGEFTTDTAGQRLFIAWNGTTSSPNGYQVYDPSVSTVATQLENSTGGAPVAFSFAPAPPPMAITSVQEPAGDTTNSFQLEIFGHGFIQNSSAASVINGAGVPTAATTTTVMSPGVILATFPKVATGIYDVNVINNDGQTSTLKGWYQGLDPTTAVITTVTTNLPPLTSGYAMLSYPQYATVGDLRAAIASQLGSYDPTLFRLFLWEQTGYLELNDPKLSPAQSIMGVGFFGLSRYGDSVSITAPDVAGNTPGTRVVAISPGWNLISQPYFSGVTQTLQYSNLLVSSTPDQGITQSATLTTLVSNVVYELQGGVYVPTTALTAGKAYWIMNNIGSPVYLIYTRAAVNKPGVPTSGPPDPLSPPAPPGQSLGGASSGRSAVGCGLLGVEAVLVVLFLRGRRRRRLAA
jgi:hypothetical protein